MNDYFTSISQNLTFSPGFLHTFRKAPTFQYGPLPRHLLLHSYCTSQVCWQDPPAWVWGFNLPCLGKLLLLLLVCDKQGRVVFVRFCLTYCAVEQPPCVCVRLLSDGPTYLYLLGNGMDDYGRRGRLRRRTKLSSYAGGEREREYFQ